MHAQKTWKSKKTTFDLISKGLYDSTFMLKTLIFKHRYIQCKGKETTFDLIRKGLYDSSSLCVSLFIRSLNTQKTFYQILKYDISPNSFSRCKYAWKKILYYIRGILYYIRGIVSSKRLWLWCLMPLSKIVQL